MLVISKKSGGRFKVAGIRFSVIKILPGQVILEYDYGGAPKVLMTGMSQRVEFEGDVFMKVKEVTQSRVKLAFDIPESANVSFKGN